MTSSTMMDTTMMSNKLIINILKQDNHTLFTRKEIILLKLQLFIKALKVRSTDQKATPRNIILKIIALVLTI